MEVPGPSNMGVYDEVPKEAFNHYSLGVQPPVMEVLGEPWWTLGGLRNPKGSHWDPGMAVAWPWDY